MRPFSSWKEREIEEEFPKPSGCIEKTEIL